MATDGLRHRRWCLFCGLRTFARCSRRLGTWPLAVSNNYRFPPDYVQRGGSHSPNWRHLEPGGTFLITTNLPIQKESGKSSIGLNRLPDYSSKLFPVFSPLFGF